MKIGFIGLGKMGSRMAARLLRKRHKVVLYARHPKSMGQLIRKGVVGTKTYGEFARRLGPKKTVFLMVPHGNAVDDVLKNLEPHLNRGDIVIDGGNSYYKNSIRRSKKLAEKGVHFLDAGISGGLEGAEKGASIMVGGSRNAFKKAERIFKELAVKNGYGYMGKSGAGHFVKMAHNAIEYSLLQSYGEGYELLEKSGFRLDLGSVTRVYRNGSVIRSWLLDLLARALEKDPKLKGRRGLIGGGSTGNWALKAAQELGVGMPLLGSALRERKKSFKKPGFSHKVVATLRFEFGGHVEPKKRGLKWK